MSDEAMKHYEAFGTALAKLSPADQERALTDLLVYGVSYIWSGDDGTARLISPSEREVVVAPSTGGLQPVADALPEEKTCRKFPRS